MTSVIYCSWGLAEALHAFWQKLACWYLLIMIIYSLQEPEDLLKLPSLPNFARSLLPDQAAAALKQKPVVVLGDTLPMTVDEIAPVMPAVVAFLGSVALKLEGTALAAEDMDCTQPNQVCRRSIHRRQLYGLPPHCICSELPRGTFPAQKCRRAYLHTSGWPKNGLCMQVEDMFEMPKEPGRAAPVSRAQRGAAKRTAGRYAMSDDDSEWESEQATPRAAHARRRASAAHDQDAEPVAEAVLRNRITQRHYLQRKKVYLSSELFLSLAVAFATDAHHATAVHTPSDN